MATTSDPPTETSADAESNGQASSDSMRLSSAMSSKKFWRDTAPKGIASTDSAAIWSKHLAKRRSPVALDTLCQAKSSPLGWGLNLQELSPRTVELLALLDQLSVKPGKSKSRVGAPTVEQILGGWLEGSHALPQSVDFALECLVVAHALPRIADMVTSEFWWALLDALASVVQSATDWRSDPSLPAEQGLAQQLLAGELPLTLAYLFPEMRPINKLRSAAHEALTEGLQELTNGDGLVQGAYLAYQRALLACWTRCAMLGSKTKKGCWSQAADELFQCLVTHSLGLSSPQGTPLLAAPNDERWSAEFLKTAIKAGGDSADAEAARSIFGKKLTAGLKVKANSPVPETSDNCEWAGVAYMRTEWERAEPVLAIDYSSRDLRLECWSGPQRLLAGTWTWETTVDGKRLEPTGTWDETCWFSDEDVDYLELSMDLSGGATLERQILLARDEMFLLLCDYVLDTAGGQLCHRYRLPLDETVEFEPEHETREGLLKAGKSVARVLPLALPEWRTDPRIGQLTSNNGRLQLEQERPGTSMACPLLIDLQKSRAKKPCTWRQLTVAQSLEIQPPDVAVGYRAQCGKDQWLIYRSLAEAANRTVLGQNLSNECLVARFLAPEGEVDELLEIE